MIKKAFAVIIFIVLLLFLGYCGLTISQSRGCGCVKEIERTAISPPYYQIPTSSLTYITKNEPVLTEDDRLGITDYYYKQGGKWRHREGTIYLNPDAYGGDINIIKVE